MKKRGSRARIQLLRFGFVGLLMVVVGRIYYVQHPNAVLKSDENSRQWDATQVIQPMRGSIYDANGDKLAFDVPAYDLDIYIPGIRAAGSSVLQAVTDGLSRILQVSPDTVAGQLARQDVTWLRWSPYMVDVTLQTKQQVVALFDKWNLLSDITPYQTFKREYPGGTFASDVIGFVDPSLQATGKNVSSEQGVAGVELQYNNYLTGRSGQQKYVQDLLGNPLPFGKRSIQPVQNGDNVYLTLDASIQHYAEEALARIQKRNYPAHATIIVSNPNTGAILALATLPNYNPNTYWTYPSSDLNTNWALSDFEPGSTFKIVTLTGALATNAINLNQTYLSGVDYVDGVPLHDWQTWGWGRITYRQAMLLSSNVGFIHIGQAEGPFTLARYIHRFGMDKPTGIDLPGESNSILFDPQNINPVDFATSTFGQGLSVTPIQQIQEIDAVANGGRLLTPYVVQKVVNPQGKIVYNRAPKFVRQVAPAAIMKEITQVLVQDVTEGIDSPAAVPGYEEAGKTGTANIPNPNGGGYYANKYNLSFIGFIPANRPQLAIYVTVNEPHHTIQYGNDVASPAAKFVLQQSLQYLRIPPQKGDVSSPWKQVSSVRYATVPNVVGMNLRVARTLLLRSALAPVAVDEAGRVARQWPAAGTAVTRGDQVVIATDRSASLSGSVRVPNLRGMSMLEAVNVSALLGLQIAPTGEGYAAWQSIPMGRLVPLGSSVRVKFVPD